MRTRAPLLVIPLITGLLLSQSLLCAPAEAAERPAGFAEWLPKLDPAATIEAGQVVGIFGENLSLSTAGADRVLVVSTAPLLAGNDPGEGNRAGFAPVALLGQVPVRVHGSVAAGDFLFASGRNDGSATVLTAPAVTPRHLRRFLGRALESDRSDGTKTVRALVTAVDTEPFATLLAQRDALLEAQGAELEALRSKLAELDELRREVTQLSEATARLELLEANRAGKELAPLPPPG